jgi:phenylacetic acid degradation operon negative regulatory protein
VRQTFPMHARSALFDLYGDHLRCRGDRAPVAALVRMLAPLGITAPAVRTAISRMVRQGWLRPTQLDGGRGYELTVRARSRLDDAASRIYRTGEVLWDGGWDLLVLGTVADRAGRARVRSGLRFLGYAPLSDSTWIGPFPSAEVDQVLGSEGTAAARFRALDDAPLVTAREAWDLGQLGAAYSAWQQDAEKLLADPASLLGGRLLQPDEEAFAVRSVLVHEWRKFLFVDPNLPDELLPEDWEGRAAASFFTQQAARLLPAASRFVDGCLAASSPDIRPTGRRADT